MAQFIMQPQFRNPWVQNLPNMLQNMALQGVAQKFQSKQATERQRIYKKEQEEQREFRSGQSELGRTFQAEQSVLGRTFQAKQNELNRAFQTGAITDRREYNAGLLKNEREYNEKKRSLEKSFQLQISSMIPVDQQDLPAGTPNIYDEHTDKFYIKKQEPRKITTLKGKDFYWENKGGQWSQTRIPVPPKSGGITFNTKDGTVRVGGPQQGSNLKKSALEGTGVWANFGAAIDAVAGGLGVDVLIGKDGFFKDTQDARQQLRVVRQLGKSALMNSARGAIWEQKKIDKLFPDPNAFFVNPRTEARKLKSLREILTTERQYNDTVMRNSTNSKQIERLQKSNTEIERLLAHIGVDESATTQSDDALIEKYLNTP